MRPEILDEEQVKLLPVVSLFSGRFGLVRGTAIALQIGHRRSIDFDLFSSNKFENNKIKKSIERKEKIKRVFRDEIGQYTIMLKNVHFTFFYYPFTISFNKNFNDIIKLPDLLTLAAMKAYALGRRAKWKDYVDLYFITKDYHSIAQICARAKKIFGAEFNEKIFREQLSYFDDIDYSETVEYLPGFETKDSKIKKALVEFSLAE
ncbi:MAG: hypothetical protein ABIJ23_02585 [Candidatus Magasanikbacteria bacterium]